MSRYIDADKVIAQIEYSTQDTWGKGINNTWWAQSVRVKDNIVNLIKEAPTADVVEVVRCRDCIYYKANCCFNPQWDMESSPEVPMVRETDFCSYGERREECIFGFGN